MNRFYADYIKTAKPSNEKFRLHTHDHYEIYMFMEGDSNYIIEENSYHLHPHDVIVIRKNEMHRVYHNSEKPYGRLVINLPLIFFKENHCEEYEALFHKTELGNKIEAMTSHEIGLYDAFLRLKRYIKKEKCTDTPVLRGIVMEILYLLNQTFHYKKEESTDLLIRAVIEYLNQHYTEQISLSDLSEAFYISSNYLCRRFRKATGLTIHQYITNKRFALVRELVKKHSISKSASLAGFCSYPSFYRAYLEEYGISPKEGLANRTMEHPLTEK